MLSVGVGAFGLEPTDPGDTLAESSLQTTALPGEPSSTHASSTGSLSAENLVGLSTDYSNEAASEITAPAQIFQHYRIEVRADGSLWELGRGAMGITYKALDLNLRCPVALKVINRDFMNRALARERFVREARAAAQLRHPHIASVFHLGKRGEEHFYAMEFIDGETVDMLVQKRGPLPCELALIIVLQVALALAAAQRGGLVHRDIKPSNLMLLHGHTKAANPAVPAAPAGGVAGGGGTGAADLCVKVIDFGVVKWTAGAPSEDAGSTSAADLTGGGLVGTPSFASPEQLSDGEVDFRSDLYSLGCTLWYLLAGKPPFLGDAFAVVSQHLSRKPPFQELSDGHVPACVIRLLATMLAKNPERRHQSHEEFQQTLDACLREVRALGPATPAARPERGGGIARWPGATWHEQERLRRKRRAWFVAGAVLLAITILLAALMLAPWFRHEGSSHSTAGDFARLPATTRSGPDSERAGDVSPTGSEEKKSVAVLPFENLSERDQRNDYLGDGLAEDITARLARVGKELRVISRFSTMRYKKSALSPKQIATELGVGALLTGTIRQEGSGDDALLQIQVELTDTATLRLLWSAKYERQRLGRLSELQSEVAEKIADTLETRLTPGRRSAVERETTASSAAYDLYLQGREAYYRYRDEDNERAIVLFQRACELDPAYVLAHAGLADAYSQRVQRWNYPDRWLDEAVAESQRAIALDPASAEAYKALGLAKMLRGDYENCVEINRRAIELNPNLVGAIGNTGAALRNLGRLDEALGWLHRAAALDPVNPIWYYSAGDTYRMLLDDDRAEEEFRRALAVEHDFGSAALSIAHLHLLQGRLAQARQECAAQLARAPDSIEAHQLAALVEFYARDFVRAEPLYERVLRADRRGGAMNYYGGISHLSAAGFLRLQNGDVPAGHDLLAEATRLDQDAIQNRPAGGSAEYHYDLAAVFAVLGQRDRAMAHLKQALDSGWLELRSLRLDPRFASLADEGVFREFLAATQHRVDALREAVHASAEKNNHANAK
ncbi:MAG: protein kinase [Verrucomicrobia bacterium]|nr:protein kinase [Verrucomicrobiota bacterium]